MTLFNRLATYWQFAHKHQGNGESFYVEKEDVYKRQALRHSFASYAAAKTHDIPRVSMWLGHTSSNLTEKHYREGVRAAEGEAWFNIFPEEETQ